MPSKSTNEDYEEIYEALSKLDVDTKAAQLYVASLQNGPMPVSELADLLEMNRPNVYKLIHELEDVGLANFSDRKGYAKKFMVESPSVLLDKVKEKHNDTEQTIEKVEKALPTLLGKYQQGELPSKIQVFEGDAQFTKMFEMVLRESDKRNEFLGSAQDFIDLVGWKKENWFIEERIERGIFMRSLLLPSVDSNTLAGRDEDQMRETRIMEGADPFPTSFHLFGDKVIIWQPKAPLGILIEDEYIVAMLRSVFEQLWEQADS